MLRAARVNSELLRAAWGILGLFWAACPGCFGLFGASRDCFGISGLLGSALSCFGVAAALSCMWPFGASWGYSELFGVAAWWLLVAVGGCWWLLVAVGGCWWLLLGAAGCCLVLGVAGCCWVLLGAA